MGLISWLHAAQPGPWDAGSAWLVSRFTYLARLCACKTILPARIGRFPGAKLLRWCKRKAHGRTCIHKKMLLCLRCRQPNNIWNGPVRMRTWINQAALAPGEPDQSKPVRGMRARLWPSANQSRPRRLARCSLHRSRTYLSQRPS